jgi:hypothetical protein
MSVQQSDKPEIEQSEYDAKSAADLEWANRDDLVDIDRKPGILGYFLKKNPSPEFIADLATMNGTELDPKEVARM